MDGRTTGLDPEIHSGAASAFRMDAGTKSSVADGRPDQFNAVFTSDDRMLDDKRFRSAGSYHRRGLIR
jgi:hypothetical protein